jgi:hypothetical protein
MKEALRVKIRITFYSLRGINPDGFSLWEGIG